MKMILLANILTPYRKFFYDTMHQKSNENGDEFEVYVMANTEPGRNWFYQEFKTDYTTLLKGKLIQVSNIYTIVNTDLYKRLKQAKPDCIVVNGSYMLISAWIALIYGKLNHCPVYYWSESHDDEARSYNKVKMMLRTIFRKATIGCFDGFWYAGKKSRAMLEKYSSRKAKYVYVPNLVDNSKFGKVLDCDEIVKARKQYNIIDGNKKIFICPARLHPAKGLLEFITLFSKCDHKKAMILIPGDGELKERIEKLIKELDVDVRLLGYCNETEMVKLYGISDILLLPSKSDPNPLSCIEACWRGLPLLVSTHVGNHPEIIKQGKNGFVFSYSDEKSAVEIINNAIYANKEWLETASKVSHDVAITQYEPNTQCVRIISEMKSLI